MRIRSISQAVAFACVLASGIVAAVSSPPAWTAERAAVAAGNGAYDGSSASRSSSAYRRIRLETRAVAEAEFMAEATDDGELAAGDAASVWYERVSHDSEWRYLFGQTYGARSGQGEITKML